MMSNGCVATVIVQRGSRVRFCDLRVPGPELKTKAPSIQSTPKGMTWGRPSGSMVASQAVWRSGPPVPGAWVKPSLSRSRTRGHSIERRAVAVEVALGAGAVHARWTTDRAPDSSAGPGLTRPAAHSARLIRPGLARPGSLGRGSLGRGSLGQGRPRLRHHRHHGLAHLVAGRALLGERRAGPAARPDGARPRPCRSRSGRRPTSWPTWCRPGPSEVAAEQHLRVGVVGVHVLDDPGGGADQRIGLRRRRSRRVDPAHAPVAADVAEWSARRGGRKVKSPKSM